MMNNCVYVVSAQRTAIGKLGGTLKDVQPDDLLLPLFENLLEKKLLPDHVFDEVIIGQFKQKPGPGQYGPSGSAKSRPYVYKLLFHLRIVNRLQRSDDFFAAVLFHCLFSF